MVGTFPSAANRGCARRLAQQSVRTQIKRTTRFILVSSDWSFGMPSLLVDHNAAFYYHWVTSQVKDNLTGFEACDRPTIRLISVTIYFLWPFFSQTLSRN